MVYKQSYRIDFLLNLLDKKRVLIYMSIITEIEDRTNRGDLIVIEPLMDSDPQDRQIYVTPNVYNMLIGPWKDERQETEWMEARAIMDTFIAGRLISVSSLRKSDVPLKLLDTKPFGLWELRATNPRPGIRLFGLFCARDCFVIFSWRDRSFLGNARRLWNEAFRDCKAKWNSLFHPYKPLEGADCNEYISNITVI